MHDSWIAECIPCGWEAQCPDENDAITQAENHVNTTHPRVSPTVRGDKKMGHVTQRTVLDPWDEPSSPQSQASSGTTRADDVQAGATSADSGVTHSEETPAPAAATDKP